MLKYTLLLMTLAALTVSAESIDLNILQTSDIHGRLGRDDVIRIGSIITESRQKASPENTLLIDSGDLTQGTFSVLKTDGMLAIDFLNAFKYDVWVPGNHELDYKLDLLIRQSREFKGACLAANIEFTGARKIFPAWRMFERQGLKIAIIGLSFPFLKRLPLKEEKSFTLCDYIPTLEHLMPEVMKYRPDIILLAVHYSVNMSYNNDDNSLFAVASKFPQIDLILGGHTHQVISGRKIGRGTWYVEPGMHSQGVMETTLTYNVSAHRVSQTTSRFITAPQSGVHCQYPPSMAHKLQAVKTAGSKITGYIPETRDNGEQLRNITAKAIMEATGADIAFITPPRRNAVLTGIVTEEKLFNAYPYNDPLMTMELSRAQIEEILQEQLTRKSHYTQSPYNIDYTFNSATGNVRVKAQPGRKTWKCVMSGYTIGNANRWFPVLHRIASKESPAVDTGILIRTAVKNYIHKHHPYSQGK
ncbi:MAG: bifunctional metallophosphatase/5'-nucleotidase [Victivallales bacterium]|nr:bifunctional metallophosphatase/5'-nucleotidase [Victivallales bacterium]